MKPWLFVLTAAVLAAGPLAHADPAFLARTQDVFRKLNASKCADVLPDASAIAAAPDFANLRLEGRWAFLQSLTRCAWRSDRTELALEAVDKAIALDAPWAPESKLRLSLDNNRDPAALAAFDIMAARTPDRMRALDERIVWGLLRAANRLDRSGTRALAIHETLLAQSYKPEYDAPDDALRLSHARLALRHGQTDRAHERLATIEGVRHLLTIRVDKLFDPVRDDPVIASRLDLTAAAERDVARARARMQAQPRRLEHVQALAQALHVLGRCEEALSEIDRALGSGATSRRPGLIRRYDDVGEQLNWVLNEKAYLLYDLNRPVEARETFRAAIAAGEQDGGKNVSQTINFASRLEAEGRPREALAMLRRMGPASPYGDMWAASVKTCAADQLGDAALRTEQLAFLKAHEADNPAALAAGLICTNDLDGAAALYLRRLSDPDRRGEALEALQKFRRFDSPAMVRNPVMAARLAAIRDRPDVIAAVEAVGRIETVPLFSVYWGDV